MPSVNRVSFISLQSMFIISFSCCIALDQASSEILNRSGKGGHPCIIPDFKGKAFRLSSLTVALGWVFGVRGFFFLILKSLKQKFNCGPCLIFLPLPQALK